MNICFSPWRMFFIFAIALLLVPTGRENLFAQIPPPSSVEDATVILDRAAAVLAPALAGLEPKPEMRHMPGERQLAVKYRTQVFKIHGAYLNGGFEPSPHDEVGPGFKGFILEVAVEPLHFPHQFAQDSVTGYQTPYWKLDYNIVPVDGKNQIYWVLSYNVRTDDKLLAEMETALNGLKE